MLPPRSASTSLASGETAVTVHRRMKRTSWSFFTWSESNTSCARIVNSKTVMFRYRLRKDSMTRGPLPLVYRNLAQQPEIAQHAAGAQHHGCQRIVGDGNRQPGFFADALVQVLQQGAAAGQHDAAIADIGAQLGRSALQRHADGIHNHGDGLRERLADFAIVHRDGARHALDQVTPLDFRGKWFVERIRRADLYFDGLRRAIADQQVVLAFQVLGDGLIHFAAGYP